MRPVLYTTDKPGSQIYIEICDLFKAAVGCSRMVGAKRDVSLYSIFLDNTAQHYSISTATREKQIAYGKPSPKTLCARPCCKYDEFKKAHKTIILYAFIHVGPAGLCERLEELRGRLQGYNSLFDEQNKAEMNFFSF